MTTTGRNTTGQGYISIPNWDTFQHYKDRQPAWVKLHLSLLGNDTWLALSGDDAKLLITIWMLIARYGNGRVPADKLWLQRQSKSSLTTVYRESNDGLSQVYGRSNAGLSNRYRGLERLIEAGFIEVCASKALERRYHDASPEVEGSKEPKKERESAHANGAAVNGSYAARQKVLANAIAGARALTAGDTPELAEKTIREAYDDDLVPSILSAVITPATKEPH